MSVDALDIATDGLLGDALSIGSGGWFSHGVSPALIVDSVTIGIGGGWAPSSPNPRRRRRRAEAESALGGVRIEPPSASASTSTMAASPLPEHADPVAPSTSASIRSAIAAHVDRAPIFSAWSAAPVAVASIGWRPCATSVIACVRAVDVDVAAPSIATANAVIVEASIATASLVAGCAVNATGSVCAFAAPTIVTIAHEVDVVASVRITASVCQIAAARAAGPRCVADGHSFRQARARRAPVVVLKPRPSLAVVQGPVAKVVVARPSVVRYAKGKIVVAPWRVERRSKRPKG